MKKWYTLLLAAALLLSGCAGQAQSAMAEETIPTEPTVAANGNENDVTCLGTYTGAQAENTVIAQVADAQLTNAGLQPWYQAAQLQHQKSGQAHQPDWNQDLATQPCPLDASVNSWQQYFLREALTAWHTAQALIAQGEAEGLPREAAYQPREKYYETYMDGKPAARYLYGYYQSYRPNTMHEGYLEQLPDLLAEKGLEGEAYLAFARDYNLAYMYFTDLAYHLERPALAEAGDGERRVDLRHIQVATEEEAYALLTQWAEDTAATEATFAELAVKHSLDGGSAKNGGSYVSLSREQLPEALATWCFDPARTIGDTGVIAQGGQFHVLYLAGLHTLEARQAQVQEMARQREALLSQARDARPMTACYSSIQLLPDAPVLSFDEILYPDIAHERFPEVPLYLQQDYTGTKYGDYKLTTNGCGITSLAMIASYLADDELTPPELSAQFGRYSKKTGTSGSLFEKEPSGLGFYLIKKSHDWREVREYMLEGHQAVVVQHKGYWTRGGHYLVLEKMGEDGRVQVRDSNIYNYIKLRYHKEDLFSWDLITPHGAGYWIFEKKVTTIPACARCGDGTGILLEDYLCEKCQTATLRRAVYLNQ